MPTGAGAQVAAVLLAEQRMMPRFCLAHIWLIGGVADDRIWLHRSAALPAALTDGFKGAFTWPESSAPLTRR